MHRLSYFTFLILSFIPFFSVSAQIPKDSILYFDFPQVDIIDKRTELMDKTPGSAGIVSESFLNNNQSISGNEALRSVSGINIVEEEGAGLRANISIRGLDPDRSRTVLMLEDGIPVALAPYGEPEMYYTPSIDRMSSIEIVKGSGSILFGPQTIGGVINYITPDPPSGSLMQLNLRSGNGGLLTGKLTYGTSYENMGLTAGILHRQADKIGTVHFSSSEIFSKIKINTGVSSRLGIKLAAYDETSNSTYVGLTWPMYENEEYYKVIAPDDKLNIRRYSASLTHELFISSRTMFKTTAFGYTTSRNWLRQDFSRSPVADNTGIILGDTTLPGGAIYMRNSTGNRNRQFEVLGIEPRFITSFDLFDLKNEMEGGIRFLYERAYEQRVNGKKAGTLSGELKEDEIRTGYAESLFFLDRIYFSDNFSVAPGVRLESFEFERDIYRIDSKDTLIQAVSSLFEVVPGIGINYNLNNISIFAGIHRGFAPPRIKDAINNSGIDLQLDAELSWNYEVGIRARVSDRLLLETTAFMLDFSNQVIPVSQSSGGTGTGLVNGGRTLHTGVEAAFTLEFFRKTYSDFQLKLRSSATFSKAKYNSDRFITNGSESVNVNGFVLPYAPELIIYAGLEFTYTNFSLLFNGQYTGEQFTDEINTKEAPATGLSGIMPEFIVLNTTAKYFINDINSSFYVSVKNILDERYIASRRPEGIRAGLPRMVYGGIELMF